MIRIFKDQRLLKNKKKNKNNKKKKKTEKTLILPFVMIDFVFTKRVFYSEKVSEVLEAYYCIPLVRWSLYKYKYLWDVGGNARGSSLKEGASHSYTLRLCKSRNSILYKKIKSFGGLEGQRDSWIMSPIQSMQVPIWTITIHFQQKGEASLTLLFLFIRTA